MKALGMGEGRGAACDKTAFVKAMTAFSLDSSKLLNFGGTGIGVGLTDLVVEGEPTKSSWGAGSVPVVDFAGT